MAMFLSSLLFLLLFVEFQVLDNFTDVKLAALRWDVRHPQPHRQEFQDSHEFLPNSFEAAVASRIVFV